MLDCCNPWDCPCSEPSFPAPLWFRWVSFWSDEFLSFYTSVVVWIRNVPRGLMYLNPQSSVGGSAWGRCELLGGETLLEETSLWGQVWKFIILFHPLFSSSASCVDGVWSPDFQILPHFIIIMGHILPELRIKINITLNLVMVMLCSKRRVANSCNNWKAFPAQFLWPWIKQRFSPLVNHLDFKFCLDFNDYSIKTV